MALKAPYMHSGAVPGLAAVLDFYDPGSSRSANPHAATNQRAAQFPARVTDKQAIIAFLTSLTASTYGRTVPAAVPSGLPVGGTIR